MTDLERFVSLYHSVGIELLVEDYAEDILALHLYVGESEKAVGYRGFGTDILFDKTGKFIRQEFWEE